MFLLTRPLQHSLPRAALIITLLQAPAWAFLQNSLPFLIQKAMHPPHYILALLFAVRPIAGAFAVLWQRVGAGRPDFVRYNTVWSLVGASLPLLLAPWASSPLFWVAAILWSTVMIKGRQGAWSELLRTCEQSERSRLQTTVNVLGYCLGAVLPIFFGDLLDRSFHLWSFVAAACGVSLIAAGFAARLLLPVTEKVQSCRARDKVPMRSVLQNREYCIFVLGTMIAGTGLLLLQPQVPGFLLNKLGFSLRDCAVAVGGAKALGYVVSARAWRGLCDRTSLVGISWIAGICTILFPMMLMGAYDFTSVLVAYLCYGIMQAGSELSWHLSPAFYGQKDSALPYMASNHLLMATRGACVPLCAPLLIQAGGLGLIFPTAILGGLVGTLLLFWEAQRERRQHAVAADQSRLSP